MAMFVRYTGGVTLASALALVGLILFHPTAAAQGRRLEPAALLDAYSQGRFDEALAPVHHATRGAVQDFRQRLVLGGIQWIGADPAARPRRALAAAAFALEVERVRAERNEWTARGDTDCAGRCVIDWASTMLQSRGTPDEAERTWLLASIALVGGVRDWSFLQAPIAVPSPRIEETGHVHRALARFPDEARFRFARAVALASRYAVTGERDGPRANTRTPPAGPGPLVGPPILVSGFLQGRTRLADYLKEEFASLAADPVVGSEARMRLAYVHWVRGEDGEALAAAIVAAEGAKTAELKYMASFLAAQAAQALGDLAAAEGHYRAALAARPHSQSATLGLAALLYVRGEAQEAYDLVDASRANRSRDDDPWRLLLYGDFAKLPALVAELRRTVTP